MLVTAGRVRVVAAYAFAVAVLNVAISLALTPSLGIDGVVLGTTIAYVVAFPVFVWIVVSTFPVRLTEIAREVWLPAYATGVLVAVALLLARISLPLDTVPAVLGAAALALLAYWGAHYFTWLRPGERALIKAVGSCRSRPSVTTCRPGPARSRLRECGERWPTDRDSPRQHGDDRWWGTTRTATRFRRAGRRSRVHCSIAHWSRSCARRFGARAVSAPRS